MKQKEKHGHGLRRMSPFGRLFKFMGWWFGFAGLYSMFGVCPCCGRPGCPVGFATAGTLGAFFALCVQDWKILLNYLKYKLSKARIRKKIPIEPGKR